MRRTPSPSTRARRIGMRGVERARGNWRRGLRVGRACGRERDSARKCLFGAQTPRDTPACRMSCKTGAARNRSCASLGGDSLTPTAIDFPSLMRWLLVRRRRYLQHEGRIAIECNRPNPRSRFRAPWSDRLEARRLAVCRRGAAGKRFARMSARRHRRPAKKHLSVAADDH